jgi:hypothetical protein
MFLGSGSLTNHVSKPKKKLLILGKDINLGYAFLLGFPAFFKVGFGE